MEGNPRTSTATHAHYGLLPPVQGNVYALALMVTSFSSHDRGSILSVIEALMGQKVRAPEQSGGIHR
ncbi:MAG: hypothetical protein LBB80_02870 [Treponema sp.]|nr:hypothetical protein [Treponema sp.]